MLRVLLIYPHSPSGAARPRDRAYISVKPLAAMLQPINVTLSLLDQKGICQSAKVYHSCELYIETVYKFYPLSCCCFSQMYLTLIFSGFLHPVLLLAASI